MERRIDNMVSLLDARLPLVGTASFAHQFPYPVYPSPPSMPAPPRGHFRYPEHLNGWSYYPPRMPPGAVICSYPNLSYHDSSSCGADVQLLSSPDMPHSIAGLPQQQGLMQLGGAHRQQPLSQFPASPSNSSQQLSQLQCLSSSAEQPRLSSQQTTKPHKDHSSSQKSDTMQRRKLHHTRLLRSSKSASTDPSSSTAQQSSIHKSSRVSSRKRQRSNKTA